MACKPNNKIRRSSPPPRRFLMQYAYSLTFGVFASFVPIIISLDQVLFGSKNALSVDFVLVPITLFVFSAYMFKFHIKRLGLGYISAININKKIGGFLFFVSLLNIVYTVYMISFSDQKNLTSYTMLLVIEIPTFMLLLVFSSLPYRCKWYNPRIPSGDCEIPDADEVIKAFPNAVEDYGEWLDPALKSEILRRKKGVA